jgi:hypothetical protein
VSTRVKPHQIVIRCSPGVVAALDAIADPRESRAATIRRLIRESLVQLKGDREAKQVLATKDAPAAPWRARSEDES